MLKKICFVFILWVVATILKAETGTITGTVSDKKTGEGIIGASVSIENTNTGAFTDRDGKFTINGISAGKYKVKVSYLTCQAVEVEKRIPGISILDSRFIIARGLAQRYNNVWINNNAVPSSEADSRSFSFDMIPSGQIENILITKSPTLELPADFTGGFVKIATRNMPSDNSTQLSYGLNFNTRTHFRDFKYAKGGAMDFLGFDNGFQGMQSVVPGQRMDNENTALVTGVTRNGFNNDWTVHTKQPIPDQRFSLMLNRYKNLENSKLGLVSALNYSYTNQTYSDMTNSRFGVYNKNEDTPVCLYSYTDNQFTTTAKIGALLNLTWMNNGNRIEFRNMFNQTGRDRYTHREGWRNVSAKYLQQKDEYFYNSRGSYAGQLSGNHTIFHSDKFDWTIGYAYANKNQPDRRQTEREEETADPRYNSQFYIDHNDIIRDFNHLDENMYSLAANYHRDFAFCDFRPSLKAGVRYENNSMALANYVTVATGEKEKHEYKQSDLFPSVNATYTINKKHLLRAAYGKAINRAEFREVSPSTYYDFDLFSYVLGNKDLKPAYIQKRHII